MNSHQTASRQEILNTRMVVDALQDITRHFSVEVSHRKLHQFNQEIRNEGNVNARPQMQQYPATDKLHGTATEAQHQLSHQYQIYKVKVLVINSKVYNRLRKKWEHQLYHATQKQA